MEKIVFFSLPLCDVGQFSPEVSLSLLLPLTPLSPPFGLVRTAATPIDEIIDGQNFLRKNDDF
jgi:hypothetical protein